MQMMMQTMPVLPSVGEKMVPFGTGNGGKPAAHSFALLLGGQMEGIGGDPSLISPSPVFPTAPAALTEISGALPEPSFAGEKPEEALPATDLPLWPLPEQLSTPPQGTDPLIHPTSSISEGTSGMPTPAEEVQIPVVPGEGETALDFAHSPVPEDTAPAIGTESAPEALQGARSELPVLGGGGTPAQQAAAAPVLVQGAAPAAQTAPGVSPLAPAPPEAAADHRPAPEKRTGLMDRQFARFFESAENSTRSGGTHPAVNTPPMEGINPAGEVATPAVLPERQGENLFSTLADETARPQPVHTAPSHPLTASATPQAETRPVPDTPALVLPSGQSVPETKIVDQVIGRLSLAPAGEGGSVTLKLNPEELGEVQVDLVLEKDRVKAQIIAQSQQVQEILEKHLPKLRSALENQGLKLESLNVSVDSQGDGGRGFFQEHQRPSAPVRFALRGEALPAMASEPAPLAVPREGRGINVRI